MSKVKLGPFSRTDVAKLKLKLQKEGISLESEVDPDLVREKRTEYMFVEVEKSHLPRIKKDLDEMGFAIVTQAAGEPGEGEGGDYYCPTCDYKSNEPGVCPDHGLRLLDFSSFGEEKRFNWRRLRSRAFFWVSVFLTVLIFGYGIFFFIRDHWQR